MTEETGPSAHQVIGLLLRQTSKRQEAISMAYSLFVEKRVYVPVEDIAELLRALKDAKEALERSDVFLSHLLAGRIIEALEARRKAEQSS